MVNKEKIKKYVDAINYMNDQKLIKNENFKNIVSEENKINITINLLRELYGDLFNDGVILTLAYDVKNLIFRPYEMVTLSFFINEDNSCSIKVENECEELLGYIDEFEAFCEKILLFCDGEKRRSISLDKTENCSYLICNYSRKNGNPKRLITYDEKGLIKSISDCREVNTCPEFELGYLDENRETIIDENFDVIINHSYGNGSFKQKIKSPEKKVTNLNFNDLLKYYSLNDSIKGYQETYINYFPELKNIIMEGLSKKHNATTENEVGKRVL